MIQCRRSELSSLYCLWSSLSDILTLFLALYSCCMHVWSLVHHGACSLQPPAALQCPPVNGDHQRQCQFDMNFNKARPARLDRELLAWISKFWFLIWFLLQALFQIPCLEKKKKKSIFLARSCVQGNVVWSFLGILYICSNARSPTYLCIWTATAIFTALCGTGQRILVWWIQAREGS